MDTRAIILVKRISAVTLLITILVTWRLWLPESLWAVSVVEDLGVPAVLQWGIGIAFIAWMLYCAVSPQGVLQGIILLLLVTLLVMTDLNRGQVWMLHFLFVALLPGKLRDQDASHALAFMTGVTYVFSGMSKFNPAFGAEVLPWMLEPFHLPAYPWLSWIIPGIELVTGLLLFLPNFRYIAATVAIGMHLLIVFVLLYHGWNYAVIPWNLAIIAAHLWIIKAGRQSWRFTELKLIQHLAFFLLIPVLSCTGLLHRSFSFSMYSGNQLSGILVCSESFMHRLPAQVKSIAQKVNKTPESYVNLDRLSIDRMGVPLFQDERCYKALVRDIVAMARDRDDLLLMIRMGQVSTRERDRLWIYTAVDLKP